MTRTQNELPVDPSSLSERIKKKNLTLIAAPPQPCGTMEIQAPSLAQLRRVIGIEAGSLHRGNSHHNRARHDRPGVRVTPGPVTVAADHDSNVMFLALRRRAP